MSLHIFSLNLEPKFNIMKLKNIVLHQLIKGEGSIPKENYSDHLLPIDDSDILDFVNNFITVYGKRRPTYGAFEENKDEYPFQKYVDEYLSSNDFLQFSLKAMGGLKKAINKPTTKGGYVIFIHYEYAGTDYIITTMLDNRPGFAVNENKLNIEKLKTLNLDELVRANRINVKKWKDGEDSYLTFIKGKRDVSKFFQEFIGNTDLTSARVNAKKFETALKDYMREKEYDYDKRTEVNSKLREYTYNCIDKEEDIELASLSAIINPEQPDDFSLFTEKNDMEVSGSFRATKKSDFQFYSKSIINGKGFNLKFEKNLIQEGVIERRGNDIIIHNVDEYTLDREFSSNE